MYLKSAFFLTILITLIGCSQSETRDASQAAVAPHDLFWENFQQHCGRSYSGSLTHEPPGDGMLTGTEELIVHFRQCGENEMKLPFHIEVEDTEDWNRSRTWILTRDESGLEIRHDHRKPDGSDDDVTMYGGSTATAGTANRQEFVSVPRSEEEGVMLGWRLEIEPNESYTYGTIREGEWTWRIDFDLSQPVPDPPAPWGHE